MSAVMKPESWQDLPKQDEVKFVQPKGDERKRLIRARTALVLGNPFFGLLALRLALVEAPWIITAGTDGKRFVYNPAYIASLTEEEVRGLWGHEVLHCTNGHLWRKGAREHRKFNIAADYAIDPILVEAGLKVPQPLINPPWKGKAAEQIYNLLPEPPKRPAGGGGQGGQPQAGDQQSGQSGKSGEQQQPGGGQSHPQAPDYMPIKDVMLDPDDSDAKQQQAEWKEATIQAAKVAKSQGKLPANLETLITEWVAPRVDWKSAMARFVQQTAHADFTWQKPSNRYMAMGQYMPKIESEEMPPMVFGWDTSGSHWAQETQNAVAAECLEIIASVKPQKVYIVFFDATVQAVEEYEPGDAFTPKPKGGGGTDFRPVTAWIEKEGIEPACLVMCTDCYGSFDEEAPAYPVLWASTVKPENLGTYTPPYGEVLFVDLDEEGE